MTQPYNLTGIATSRTPLDWIVNINALTHYLLFSSILIIIWIILIINFANNQKIGVAFLNSFWIVTVLIILSYFMGLVSETFMIIAITLTLLALFYAIFVEE